MSVLGDFLYAGIIDGFHEGVSVVKEIRSLLGQSLDCAEMSVERCIYFSAESLSVLMEQLGSLFKSQPCGTVSAVINIMTGSLVGEKIYFEVFFNSGFQQIDNIAVIGDGDAFFGCQLFCGQLENLGKIIQNHIHPALVIAGLNPGTIHFGEDAHGPGNVGCFRLSAAHAAQTR